MVRHWNVHGMVNGYSSTGAAQNYSEFVNITSGDVELLVDTSISPYCLQCLDGSGVALPDTVWSHDASIVTPTSDVEVVNGVLVLLDLMALIRPGRRGYTVTCQSGPLRYDDIQLFSTSKTKGLYTPSEKRACNSHSDCRNIEIFQRY